MTDGTEKTTDELDETASYPGGSPAPGAESESQPSADTEEGQAPSLDDTAKYIEPADSAAPADGHPAEGGPAEGGPAEDEPVENNPAGDELSDDGASDEQLSDEQDIDDDGEDDEPEAPPAGPIELIEDDEEEIHKDWYILKVQSNRERSIAAALQRKVAIEGLDDCFGEIMVPTEKVTEFKAGKKKIVERKIWPGYIAVEMHVNDDTWFAIRETSGIGDFTGSGGKPTPMTPDDLAKILKPEEEETDEAPKLAIPFEEGDKVKVKDGNFESFEGEVSKIDEVHGKVTVMLSIFGRPTPVELEYWQVEKL